MRHLVLAFALTLGLATVASAQVATPINHFGWTEVGQTPAVANGATYNVYVDAATVPVALTGVTCVVGTPVTDAACTSNIPALTVGLHVVTLAQNIQGAESGKSTSISFTFVIVVTPTGLILKP